MLSILSFTDLLGGPFLLAQILLFLFGGTVVLMVIALWWLWSKIKHKLSEMQGMHKADDVREATVVDGRLDNQ
jgi:low temperature requirement protein LtrA